MASDQFHAASPSGDIFFMTPPKIFGLAVRITGLVSLLYMLSASVLLFGFVGVPAFMIIMKFLVWLALTIWLLRGAPNLVRFAYPDEQ
ncbi:hypothetical protein CMV30_01590 [Nibricoccus aquaticus]|uniref:Uncharacterized protein n=1 Tax=Nibricoccus aquaticus TaxID=2576891 RepID=A0A290Q2X2_9BACT|nr:hypothetical protein [Nibricoccus aquaticus]ATC62763.1 hypothetical protein CMV30_01590 [Nibricoccus aquaticus]